MSVCWKARAGISVSSPTVRVPRPPKYIATAAEQLAPTPPNLFVGTSGWAYPSWKPGFYPAEVPSRAFLHVYAAHLTAVEVNYTFRALPTVTQLEDWLRATPPGFRFSFKAPQAITHFARLRDPAPAVERFLAALAPMQDAGRLGPLLFQLPPNFAVDLSRLRSFLEVAALHRSHSLQIAFEFRHPSWFREETYTALRDHGAALCVAETDDLVTPDIATAAFRCYRLRRDGGYSPGELEAFAARFAQHAAHGEVFAFLRHQEEPTGALNALHLRRHAATLAGIPQSAGPEADFAPAQAKRGGRP